MNILDYQSIAALNAIDESMYDISQLKNFRENFEKKHNCKYRLTKDAEVVLEFLDNKSLDVFLLKYS
ncbi:MAG: hypothetical protein RLY43_399 [Bacteroidota bacterium]|jgi:hypothetical protein